MRKHCFICNKDVNAEIKDTKETYTIRDKEIEVDTRVLTCTECGEDLFCVELDNKTLEDVFEKFERIYGVKITNK